MKICHINTLPFGGAAKAAMRLHNSLLSNGNDSFLLFGGNILTGERIIRPYSGLMRYFHSLVPYIDYIPIKLSSKKNVEKWSNNWFSSGISKTINRKDIDILNIHWIGNGFLGLKELKKIKAKKIFTLHDSWAFTGGCHLPYDCYNYNSGCGNCPQLKSKKSNDISKWISKMKQEAFKQDDFIFVSPSNWLKGCAQKSKVLKDKEIHIVKNGVDLKVFKPYDKLISREILGLNKNKITIIFSAVNNVADRLKGFHFLVEALRIIGNRNIELVVLGSNKPDSFINLNCAVYFLGPVYDEYTLAVAYSSADITVVPSISENLPFTVIESHACGTPVVAFDVGGIHEIIEHKINGWLAKAFEIGSLADGILWCIDNLHNREISLAARKSAVDRFDIDSMRKEYLSLYNKLLSKE